MSLTYLPTELLQEVARHCDTHLDLLAYMQICQTTRAAVAHDRSGIWRDRYRRFFDLPEGRQSMEIFKDYFMLYTHHRRTHFSNRDGRYKKEVVHPSKLFHLIKDSFAGVVPGEPSKNISFLTQLCNGNGMLDEMFSQDKYFQQRDLRIFQTIFFHLAVTPNRLRVTQGFVESQRIAYGNPDKFPLFKGPGKQTIDFTNLLHIANFFKWHFTCESEDSYNYFDSLPSVRQPRAWDGPLKDSVYSVGKKWIGSYSYTNRFTDTYLIRTKKNDEDHIPDIFDRATEDGFHTMQLSFDPHHQPILSDPRQWPVELAEALDPIRLHSSRSRHSRSSSSDSDPSESSLTSDPASPASSGTGSNASTARDIILGHDYLPFVGACQDRDPYLAAGAITPLAPQSSVPGFQRITFVKSVDPYPDTTSNKYLSGVMLNAAHKTAAKENLEDSCDIPTAIEQERIRRTAEFEANDCFHKHVSSELYKCQEGSIDWYHENIKVLLEDIEVDAGESLAAHALPYRRPDLHKDVEIAVGADTWYYEGVILPGGKIILGRWYAAKEEKWGPNEGGKKFKGGDLRNKMKRECGPFVYWCID